VERKAFPPSPRRLALARRAGLHAASPIVVGALACAGALVAAIATARAGATRLGAWIAAACDGHAQLGAGDAVRMVLELAAPLVVAAAVVAAIAHFAQTRSFWLPRRRLEGAPAVPRSGWLRATLELGGPAVIGAVTIGWLWLVAPRIAGLFTATSPLAGAAALLASFAGAMICAWAGLGVVEALARQLALREALAMTPAEKREDDRLSAADPRWRARRNELARTPSIAGAALVVLGDDVAVAIAWDPARQPVPLRTATGKRARATQLVALARRHRIAIHRDPALAAALADGEGPVPEPHWPQLAAIIAAVRR
jgi:flagellar biosynthesis protein FlhB